MRIACIGSGNMGSALMRGAAGAAGGGSIGFTDAERGKAEAAAKALGARVFDGNIEAAAQGDLVFLAVKPQILGMVLEEIGPTIRERVEAGRAPVLVSMAAGWAIGKIRAILAGPDQGTPPERIPVVRIMPNTPALVSQGMIALAAPPEIPADSLAALEKLLGAAGDLDRVEERYLDAVTALSGSGPAFVCLFIEALADGGVQAGLPRDKALRYAAQTVLGTAAMVRESGRHPGELKDAVCSPAGTTIAGVAALEAGAFRGTVISAVEAAYRRALALG
jgi:pyrroline-5-carboxylate reductase